MKRILVGTVVGTVLFFAYQTAMWMGGLHGDFSQYTPTQDSVLQCLTENLPEDGLYHMPAVDPGTPDRMEAQEKLMANHVGKPWAMIFYHKSMAGMEMGYILMGLLYTLIGVLVTTLVLYAGGFKTFAARFLVAMAFAIFALSQGVLDEMNWWSYPWSFIQPQVIDLTLGWGICAVWLALYVKRTTAKAV